MEPNLRASSTIQCQRIRSVLHDRSNVAKNQCFFQLLYLMKKVGNNYALSFKIYLFFKHDQHFICFKRDRKSKWHKLNPQLYFSFRGNFFFRLPYIALHLIIYGIAGRSIHRIPNSDSEFQNYAQNINRVFKNDRHAMKNLNNQRKLKHFQMNLLHWAVPLNHAWNWWKG